MCIHCTSYSKHALTLTRYDPKLNQWTDVAPMLSRRKHLGVAVLDNCIYAVGGRDENNELNSVERYVFVDQ